VPEVDPDDLEVELVDLAAPFQRPRGENPYHLQAELQDAMQSLVGIYRTADDLKEALRRLADLRARWTRCRVSGERTYNPGWNLVFELRNLLTVCEAITNSALQREESRGAHSRLDFPEADAAWGKVNSVVRRDGDGMTIATTPVPAMPAEYQDIIAARSRAAA
jgi:succinate dehydrogenase / fumarate reductase flavoprotein subunit